MEPLTKPELKELARKVVVAQGNTFIKELLRNNGIKIGVTKEDFTLNLESAIDENLLTQAHLETWLSEVEGWGDQYLYLVSPPQVDPLLLQRILADGPYRDFVGAVANLEFPDDLDLKHIALTDTGLSMVWHQRKQAWNRWKDKDFDQTEGQERFRFNAFRQRFDRSIVRYEWQFADPFSAILVHRNPDIDHAETFRIIRRSLAAIGCPDVLFEPVLLNQAVKVAAKRDGSVHTTRLEIDGGYVELGSTLAEGGIDAVAPVRAVLHSVDTGQFDRAQAMLYLSAQEDGISRRISVEVYGAQGKLRIWAQCKRQDIYMILALLWGYNNQP